MTTRASVKLYRVLVAGGLAMSAVPGCGSSSPNPGVDAAHAPADGGRDAAANPVDAAMMEAEDASDFCLNRPGDCTHGMCSW